MQINSVMKKNQTTSNLKATPASAHSKTLTKNNTKANLKTPNIKVDHAKTVKNDKKKEDKKDNKKEEKDN